MRADPKTVLRSRLRARRRELSAARDRDSDALRLAEHALALVASRTTGGGVCRVAAYAALPTEPPTDRLVAALESAGHEVILPVLLPDRSLDWVLHEAGTPVPAYGSIDGLRLGPEAIGTADVVITPGLGVDPHGNRIGQGGGSYDRALAMRRPDALVVTLLHDGERSETLFPREGHDLPVDAVITADGGCVSCRTPG